MDKVTSFLEKHVQWVALGLGVVWLAYMAYSYVITPPAQVEVAGQVRTAGDVDRVTSETVVQQLQMAINNAHVPSMPVNPFAETFLARMQWQGFEPVQLASSFMNSDATEVPIPESMQPQNVVAGTNGKTVAVPQQAVAAVDHLPTLPAATPSDSRVGRSAVQPVVQQAVPGQPAPPPQPINPAQPAELVDKDWVTQSFKLSMKDIKDQFAAAKIPQGGLTKTAFLKVELVRQEQLPNGQWGNEVIVPPLDLGIQRTAYPGPKANRVEQMTYLNWAIVNSGDILQPGFFQVVQGDLWAPPGEVVAVQNAVFQPQSYPAGTDISKLTPEQRKQVMDWRREQYRLQQQQKKQAAPRGPRRNTGDMAPEDMMDGAMYPAPRDPDRRAFAQAQRRPVRQPTAYPPDMMGMSPEDMEMMGLAPEDMGAMDGMMPQQPGLPRVGQPGVDYPAGEFDPFAWTGTDPITIFAHDDTVKPGHTYRYKMRYYLKNPLFATAGIAKNPALNEQFALVSPDSEFAAPVTIPDKVQFFIAGGLLGGTNARFDVFTWKEGIPTQKTFTVSPGDQVGRVDGDTDFSTGYTVVTMNRDEDRIVLMRNEDGHLISRSTRSDVNDPLYKKLKTDAENAAKEVAAAAGTPGTVTR